MYLSGKVSVNLTVVRVPVLLCKFSLYRAVQASYGPLSGPGPSGFNLSSLMGDPTLPPVAFPIADRHGSLAVTVIVCR